MPLRFPDLPQPNEDFFIDPYYDELQALEQQQFVPGQYRRNPLEAFAGLENQDFRRPQSFGEGFLQGLSGSVGSLGTAASQKRAQFEESDARRKAAFDANRIKRSQELRDMSGKERREFYEDKRKYERENQPIDQATFDANPWISRIGLGVGDRPTPDQRKLIGEAQQPESPKEKAARERSEATAARMDAAAQRAADAATRQERLATVNTISKLADDYRVDPDIVAYRQGQQNLATIRDAVKLKTGPGDLATLIAYVRATEPGVMSVVRQEELGNIRSALGEFRRYMNIPSQWITGQSLNDTGRKEILRAAEKITGAQKPAYERANAQYLNRSKAFEVDPTLFMREYGQPTAPQTPQAPGQYQSGGWFDRNRRP